MGALSFRMEKEEEYPGREQGKEKMGCSVVTLQRLGWGGLP